MLECQTRDEAVDEAAVADRSGGSMRSAPPAEAPVAGNELQRFTELVMILSIRLQWLGVGLREWMA